MKGKKGPNGRGRVIRKARRKGRHEGKEGTKERKARRKGRHERGMWLKEAIST
jgi:hypothetical protein